MTPAEVIMYLVCWWIACFAALWMFAWGGTSILIGIANWHRERQHWKEARENFPWSWIVVRRSTIQPGLWDEWWLFVIGAAWAASILQLAFL